MARDLLMNSGAFVICSSKLLPAKLASCRTLVFHVVSVAKLIDLGLIIYKPWGRLSRDKANLSQHIIHGTYRLYREV